MAEVTGGARLGSVGEKLVCASYPLHDDGLAVRRVLALRRGKVEERSEPYLPPRVPIEEDRCDATEPVAFEL